MSYPANLDTIVVRHKIVDTGGKPMKGNSVRAVATKRIWATDGSLIPFETTARVAADGSYEFELPYVDQDGIHNKGVPFQVTEDVPGKPRHYFIAPVLAHGAGPIDATEALVEAPVGYEVKIQAGPVTDATAAQLLDQDGQFKAALTGTFATHERLTEVATGQTAALTDSAVAGALTGTGNIAKGLLDQKADADDVAPLIVEMARGPFATKRVTETARKNAALLGVFQRRLNLGLAVTINCMGDSTTYGHDATSADRVPAPTAPMPDGSHHTFTRSPNPWPEVMAGHLNTAYISDVTVINRGYSGDTAGTAYDRWITPSGAHLTVLTYGINDDQVGGPDVAGFMANMERLIVREVNDYNAAVVIATPIKQMWDGMNRTRIEAYRHALEHLASTYGAPLIDTEPMLAGYTADTHSDGWHLNTFGNSVMGARMAAVFVGTRGPGLPFRVGHGSKLATRDTLDNLVYAENTAREYIQSQYTPADGAPFANGIDARLASDAGPGRVTYGFYTDAADLVVIPNYAVAPNRTLTCALDFGVEQGDNVNDIAIGVPQSRTERAESSFALTAGASPLVATGHPTGVATIRIANPGWHTLTFTGTGTTNVPCRLRAVEFMDYTSLRVAQQLGL